jgi:hypothetical protein
MREYEQFHRLMKPHFAPSTGGWEGFLTAFKGRVALADASK